MMTRFAAILMMFAFLSTASRAGAQCNDWKLGPIDNGTAVNGTDGVISAMIDWDPDGAGPVASRLVVAGTFTSIQGTPVINIAQRDPATGQWQPIGGGIPIPVYALTIFNGELVAGGDGDNDPASTDNNILHWTGSTWESFYGGTATGSVQALAVCNGILYAGGNFTVFPDFALNIARWDGTNWRSVASSTNGTVLALTAFGTDLYVGGSFTLPAVNIARYDGASWHDLGGSNGYVADLAVFNGEVVACGGFTTINGVSARGIAGWNGSSWHAFGGGMTGGGVFGNAVLDVAVYNGLVAGGYFTLASGQPANHVARWDGASWQPLGFGTSGGGTDDAVRCLVASGGELNVAGSFANTDGAPTNHMSRWNGYQWAPFGGGSATTVTAMTTFAGRIVAGGWFHQTAGNGSAAHNIVGWDGVTLTSFGSGMDNPVLAMKAFKYPGVNGSNELIAAGSFTHAGGVTANFIARWDVNPFIAFPPPAWEPMGAGFSNAVYAVERYNSATYAGGAFTFSSSAVSRIARWNETTDTWEPVGTGMNGPVYALKTYKGFLYAGGAFTSAGGVSTGGFARWNGTTWSDVGGFFNGTVNALEIHNDMLVMAGVFPGIGGSPNIAQYSGTSYSTLGTGGTNAAVRSLRSTGPRLYVGGDFSVAGLVSSNHMAYWDGAWHEALGGADTPVLSMELYNGELHAGGTFNTVHNGALAAPRWAKISDGLPWFAYHPFSQTVQPGATASFTGQPAAGYGPLTFQWYRYGTPMVDGLMSTGCVASGVHGQTLTLTNITPADYGDYQVAATNSCGSDTSFAARLLISGTNAVVGPANGATAFEALGPNPTAGAVRLAFSLAHGGRVRARVHDVAGRVLRVVEMGGLPAGQHRTLWDARGDDGQRLRAGLYFVGLDVDGRTVGTKRLTIVR
jgi:trimeric autotransporter adhesin